MLHEVNLIKEELAEKSKKYIDVKKQIEYLEKKDRLDALDHAYNSNKKLLETIKKEIEEINTRLWNTIKDFVEKEKNI